MKRVVYSINLAKFTVDDFGQILKSIELLPGRHILIDKLDKNIEW